MNDEVILRFGVDQRAIGAGLRGITSSVKTWGASIKSSMAAVSSSILAPLTGGALLATLNSLADKVKGIESIADAAGVTTDFVQQLQNVGKVADVSEGSIQKILMKFQQLVPAGRDAQTEFMKFSDRLAEMKDPAERANFAIKIFGDRLSMDIINLAGMGSKELMKLADSFDRLSNVDMKSISRARDEMEQIKNTATVWIGKAIGNIATTARAVGTAWANMGEKGDFIVDIPGQIAMDEAEAEAAEEQRKLAAAQRAAAAAADAGRKALADFNRHLDDSTLKSGTAEQKLAILARRWRELNAGLKGADSETRFKNLQKMFDVEQNIADIKEKANKEQKKADADAAKAVQDRLDKERDLVAARAALTTAAQDRSSWTLGELAGMGHRGAMQVQWTEQQAKMARLYGRSDIADQLTQRALDMRKSMGGILTSSEAEPLKAMQEGVIKSAEKLNELTSLAAGKGIRIDVGEE